MPIRCVQIGMMSEQSMERQNRTFKRYARLYATMGNTKKRLNTTMKRAYMAVHPSTPAFAPLKRQFKGPRKAKRNKVTAHKPSTTALPLSPAHLRGFPLITGGGVGVRSLSNAATARGSKGGGVSGGIGAHRAARPY